MAEPSSDQVTVQAIREVVAARCGRHRVTWLSGGIRRWPGIFGSLILAPLLACSTSRPASSAESGEEIRPVGTHPACENIQAPGLIKKVFPPYPGDLRRRGIQGKVTMTATLGMDGVLRDIKVSGSPNANLSRLAVEAFQRWQ